MFEFKMGLSVLVKTGLCTFMLLCFLPGKKFILFISKLGQVVALSKMDAVQEMACFSK